MSLLLLRFFLALINMEGVLPWYLHMFSACATGQIGDGRILLGQPLKTLSGDLFPDGESMLMFSCLCATLLVGILQNMKYLIRVDSHN